MQGQCSEQVGSKARTPSLALLGAGQVTVLCNKSAPSPMPYAQALHYLPRLWGVCHLEGFSWWLWLEVSPEAAISWWLAGKEQGLGGGGD